MKEQEENWAIHVDGIAKTGYTEEDAKREISNSKVLREKGAVATRLYGNPVKTPLK